jgi:hypothetical protein
MGGDIMICERFNKCPFFQKYKDGIGSIQYKLFADSYCRGVLMDVCKRLAYEESRGEKAPDNMSPDGYMIKHHK